MPIAVGGGPGFIQAAMDAPFVAHPEQPTQDDIKIADDIFVKQIVIPKADSFVPQHEHAYDHITMLAVGRIQVWQNGVYTGEFVAPTGITIKAHVKHTFRTLDDGVVLYCIHNISRTGEVDVDSEHQLPGVA